MLPSKFDLIPKFDLFIFFISSRNYRCFLKFIHVEFIIIVLVKIFDIYIELMLYIFRFIIFNYIF